MISGYVKLDATGIINCCVYCRVVWGPFIQSPCGKERQLIQTPIEFDFSFSRPDLHKSRLNVHLMHLLSYSMFMPVPTMKIFSIWVLAFHLTHFVPLLRNVIQINPCKAFVQKELPFSRNPERYFKRAVVQLKRLEALPLYCSLVVENISVYVQHAVI